MQILSQGKDIYTGVKFCNLCGCVFIPTKEDASVFYENGVCNHFVECPNCFTLIPVAISSKHIVQVIKKDKEESNNE